MSRRDDRARAFHDALANPASPDNMDVRVDLVRRVEAGEITLAEAQKQVRKLKRERKRMQREGKL